MENEARQPKAQDDDLVMSLVELALAQPEAERQAYLENACTGESELFDQVWQYVQWEQRMQGFLLDPLYRPAENEHLFEAGDLLERRFRIVREVAQGGMGVVYEAMDEKLERRIAIKCAKIGFRKRLPPEVRNASEISHPNVCKIFEMHTASTRHGEIDFITMEFLEGETLAERLRRGALPPAEARAIAQQLCAGLAEAHRNQVIHGDLKSNNVILTAGIDGVVRAVITDFGLASRTKTAHRTAQSGPLGGTPDYMAPELWRGEKATVASDIYALSVMLYELASGRRPFAPELSWETRLTTKIPAVGPKWDRILARGLDPDPARRFQNADEITQALAPRSRRWLLAAAATILLAIASAGITYQRATAPQQSVRLAVLPFESSQSAAPLGVSLLRAEADQLARVKGNSHTKLAMIPLSGILSKKVDTIEKARTAFGATHALQTTLEKQNDKVTLHAYLTDTRSGVHMKDWRAEYKPSELQYAPIALAGVVTSTLHLPPVTVNAAVNAAARQDYQTGLSYVRRDTGVDAALAFLERAVAADPGSPLTHAGLTEAEWFKYFLTNDRLWLARAAESLRQAEIRNSDLAPVHRMAGILKANDGRYEQAEAEYRRAIELEPGNGDAHRRLGQVYERNNQPDDALAEYRRALDADPGYYRTYQALGSLYLDRAAYSEALKYFRKAVELAPDEPSVRLAFGSTFTDLGRFAEAESEFRFAIHLRETPRALHALGLTLMYEGRDEEAIPYFLSALKQNPERFLSWMELGNCYRRINQPAESVRANRRGLELVEAEVQRNPRNGYLRSFLAYLCARLGDRRRAESDIAQAMQLSPSDANTLGIAATTYEALGQRDTTLAVLKAAPEEVIEDLSRWPDVADLQKDSRFKQLLASRQIR